MPELPDVLAYLSALEPRVVGKRLESVRLGSPFLLRSVSPPLPEAEGRRVVGLRRIGKRLVFELEGDLFLVLHLMIAGRLHWRGKGAKVGGRNALAAFDFEDGTLVLTEAGSKRRASLHLVRKAGLAEFERGGIEVLESDSAAFRSALTRENHTVKRALTDPRLFSGIGNAYSDEILHRARISPVRWTSRLTEAEIERLWQASCETLAEWTRRLVSEAKDRFPGEGDGLSRGDGRARALPRALPCLRLAGPADRVRRERSELLRGLPDGRQAPRGSGSVAAAAGRLAEDARRARGAASCRRRGARLTRRIFSGAALAIAGLVASASLAGQELVLPSTPEFSILAGAGHSVKVNRGETTTALVIFDPEAAFRLGSRFQWLIEGHYSHTFSPDGWAAGLLPLGARYYLDRSRYAFYVEFLAGFCWTNLEIEEIDRRFNFVLTGGPGLALHGRRAALLVDLGALAPLLERRDGPAQSGLQRGRVLGGWKF
jgi:formamidopyrimidine-DNA glycosylase